MVNMQHDYLTNQPGMVPYSANSFQENTQELYVYEKQHTLQNPNFQEVLYEPPWDQLYKGQELNPENSRLNPISFDILGTPTRAFHLQLHPCPKIIQMLSDNTIT